MRGANACSVNNMISDSKEKLTRACIRIQHSVKIKMKYHGAFTNTTARSTCIRDSLYHRKIDFLF
ncbi:hypothetical protein BIW11_03916 [Tropilaelaps mercedesae]|uniref:Uncharacterized protein n=1 Tax=Tropilaelaps mercedesae TaxID=418985 RepID=A0A1V9XE81_9ACAR|nr:hypothetical protein BIW11_03916 [Tropilaelaps mercedesae]